ncbi:hypothetical protein JTB14_025140 [Gonioctena quinquepunctata]|nr:hypothetical protein JTB14_025140 [Gonioctena quinquepunctata]
MIIAYRYFNSSLNSGNNDRWTFNQLENVTVDEFDNLIEEIPSDIESDLGDYTDVDVENTDSDVANIQDCVSIRIPAIWIPAIRIPAKIPEESQEIEHSYLNDELLPSVNNLDPDYSDDDACSVDSDEVPLMKLILDVTEKCIYRKKIPAAQTFNFREESGPTISNNSEAPIDIFLELFSTSLIERIAFETNLYATQSGK